jgi:hypothetical protein
MKPLSRIASLSILSLSLAGALLLAASLSARPQSDAKPAAAQKLSASAIQVERIDPPQDLVVPEDFRIATYENVIREVTKTKKFQRVYRSGDKDAAGASDLVILHLVPEAYTAGSQKEREVTTVAGATSIKMKVQFTSKDGKVLLERDLEGKVRFYGENLRATYDLAKKVAAAVNESF